MSNRKLWVSILAGFLAAMMVFGIIASILPAYASGANEKSSEEIKEEIDALKAEQENYRVQIADLESKRSDNETELKALVSQKDVLDQQIFYLNGQMQNLNKQILAYGTLIADKQLELEEATDRWQKLNAQYKERIRTTCIRLYPSNMPVYSF